MRSGLVFALVLTFAHAAYAIAPGPVPQWIWVTKIEHDGQPAYLRQVITIEKPVRQAELHVLADDRATVFLNGTEVARCESASRATIADVTKFLREGRNVIAVEAFNERGPAGILVQLIVTPQDGPPVAVISDPRWWASELGGFANEKWKTDPDYAKPGVWEYAISKGLIGCPPWYEPIVDTPDYHQWKQARGTTATSAAEVATLPDYQVELVRSSQPGEGSWVSLAIDPKGRLFIGREGPGILRFTVPANGQPGRMEVIDNTLLECRGLLYAHDSLYAHANNSRGLYRLRDTDGNDQFDQVTLLQATPGGVGHGRNDLTLGPDGKLYLIFGNDAQLPENFAIGSSPYRNFADDRLLKCAWDKYLFDRNARLPAGHVIRTDPEGKTWELMAGGFRNPYGIDFSPDGEMFTFDADNEGDTGLPWYRPTRVNHIVSGGEYGWRQGSGIRPDWFPDTLPSTLDIGKASPTSVKFGTKSHFPEPYKSALFILDWSYGRIYAIHLLPRGASYAATADLFLAGKPLNVTDLEFGPEGEMYFVTGGRGTQSGLYRVRYVPRHTTAGLAVVTTGTDIDRSPVKAAFSALSLRSRRMAEEWHGGRKGDWRIGQGFGSPNPWLRHADRLALESQPAAHWQRLAIGNDGDLLAEATRLMAVARVSDAPLNINPSQWTRASREARLALLRAFAISIARRGPPSPDKSDEIRTFVEALFPSDCRPINQLACELLVALNSAQVVRKTMPLLASATTQEETLCWLFLLRNVKQGWTPELRRTWFKHLQRAGTFEGGRDMPTVLTSIRYEFLANVPGPERTALLAEFADPVGNSSSSLSTPARPVVKEWTLADLEPLLVTDPIGDAARGAELFTAANCIKCHRVRGQGVPVGPDLTGAALRFSRKDLLVAIVEPSRSIDEKFRNVTFELHSGKTLSGRVITGDEQRLLVSPNPLEPDALEIVPVSDVAGQTPSNVSPMPAGLLNSLTLDEIRDLLAYLDALALGGR